MTPEFSSTEIGAGQLPRVIIAEDYVLIQENIRKAIQSDCEVIGAVEDGEAALEAATTRVPDILLLDVSLPVLSGFDVAEKLNGMKSAVKVIFVTAYGDRNYVERAFAIGARGYVLKGKIWSDLPDAIRAVAQGGSYRSPLLR
jgi:DNA-binding NarL/FixJ family response regulator